MEGNSKQPRWERQMGCSELKQLSAMLIPRNGMDREPLYEMHIEHCKVAYIEIEAVANHVPH